MKPIIPNKYIINNNIIIEYRIFENEDVEIYKTQGGEYFYLLLTIAQLSNKIKNKYKVFEITIKGRKYLCFVLQENFQEKINSFIKGLTEAYGFDAVAGMIELKSQLTQNVVIPILQKEKYLKFKRRLRHEKY